jgi:hypothetical protein
VDGDEHITIPDPELCSWGVIFIRKTNRIKAIFDKLAIRI